MQAREELSRLVGEALAAARESGALALEQIPEAALERPRDEGHGDWACTVALRCAKQAKRNPREIAQAIVDNLPEADFVDKVEIAGPGFINFYLKDAALQHVVAAVREQGDDYGRSTVGGPNKVNIEYISSNPTGPMHVGHGRWAALGSATANVMRHAGYDVFEEFYINDHGVQMNKFGASIAARYLQQLGRDAEVPEGGYNGAYVNDIAGAIIERDGEKWADADERERMETFREFGYGYIMENIRDVTDRFGVHFDRWQSERELYLPDAEEPFCGKSPFDYCLGELREHGDLYESEGALWFRSSAYGDEKDRVVRKADGEYTYFASDVAYHYCKKLRGFDLLIDIWGADHHGYIARVQAVLAAMGYPGALEVMLGQLVNLFRGGKPVRMSKRTGEMITFEELIDEVGVDATRYYMLDRSSEQPIDFDIEEAKKQDASNPVYYDQYAHARICKLLRDASGHADEGGLDMAAVAAECIPADADLSLLTDASELALMRKMSEFGELIAAAARDRAPFRLTHYAQELAGLFHQFYTNCPVLKAETPELAQARLALCDACRIVLAKTLNLLGISAPQRM